MAIYHLHVDRISRGNGKSAVAAAAYRAGEKIKNERDNHTHDYEKRPDVAYAEIFTPDDAPSWAQNRSALWNEVERSEKRINANTAIQIDVALPLELDREKQMELIQDYGSYFVQRYNMAVDSCLHDKGDGNPHVHFMMTTRELTEDGFSKKKIEAIRDLKQSKEELLNWRKEWETCTNKALEKAGREERIDCRSYKDQGILKEPSIHMGPSATAVERRGDQTERGNINRAIKECNEIRKLLVEAYRGLREELVSIYQANKERVAKNMESYQALMQKPEQKNYEQELRSLDQQIKEISQREEEIKPFADEKLDIKQQAYLKFFAGVHKTLEEQRKEIESDTWNYESSKRKFEEKKKPMIFDLKGRKDWKEQLEILAQKKMSLNKKICLYEKNVRTVQEKEKSTEYQEKILQEEKNLTLKVKNCREEINTLELKKKALEGQRMGLQEELNLLYRKDRVKEIMQAPETILSKRPRSEDLYTVYAKAEIKQNGGWDNTLDQKIAAKMFIDGFEQYQVRSALRYSPDKEIRVEQMVRAVLKSPKVREITKDRGRGR